MATEQNMSSWTDLLHSSTKLLEQAAPSAQFPPLQRNLDQLETLSKKLKAKTLRNEVPQQSIAATRLLAREGLNAEQLARDLKSFELKTTFEDVFPAEATSIEDYLQQRILAPSLIMEEVDSANILGEPDVNDVDEEEEVYYASVPVSKLQPRAVVSKARWNNEMGMAEVVVQKGTFSKTTGIVRSGKLYYSIEEVLFLVEIGALLLLDESDTGLSMEDIFVKMSGGKNRCCWEEFRAYRQLKSLGYIVGRHGIPWSMKGAKSNCESISFQGFPESDKVQNLESEEIRSVIGLFNEMQINKVRPVFNVYLPNSKFRKSSPGDPSFVLCFTRGYPPSKAECEALEGQCGSIPLKFCNVEQGRVSFFSFDKVELPVLT